jgi:hypothetical protein
MKVWMVIEDDGGTRHGFEIGNANLDYVHTVDFLDTPWSLPPGRIRGQFTAQWTITTHTPYRRYWPPTAPSRPDNDITRPVGITAGQPPRETNNSAGTSRSTD